MCLGTTAKIPPRSGSLGLRENGQPLDPARTCVGVALSHGTAPNSALSSPDSFLHYIILFFFCIIYFEMVYALAHIAHTETSSGSRPVNKTTFGGNFGRRSSLCSSREGWRITDLVMMRFVVISPLLFGCSSLWEMSVFCPMKPHTLRAGATHAPSVNHLEHFLSILDLGGVRPVGAERARSAE